MHLTNKHQFAQALAESNFDAAQFIPLVEDLAQMEKNNREINLLLENEFAYLKNEQAIAQCEIMLSLLRLYS